MTIRPKRTVHPQPAEEQDLVMRTWGEGSRPDQAANEHVSPALALQELLRAQSHVVRHEPLRMERVVLVGAGSVAIVVYCASAWMLVIRLIGTLVH